MGIQQTKLDNTRGQEGEKERQHTLNEPDESTKIAITFITILMQNPDKHVKLNIPTHI